MLDPIIAFFSSIFHAIGTAIGKVILLILAPFIWIKNLFQSSGWILKGLIAIVLLCIIIPYGWFFWNASWIRNFDVDYAANYKFEERVTLPGSQVDGQAGQCGPSAIIKVAGDLIDFNVNQNQWVPSTIVSKMGLFGIPWKNTPFFDNKAAFQLGINEILRRTAQEGVDRLGRLRVTSQITKFPAPPSDPSSITSLTLHSNCTGDSATRKG